MMSILGLLFSKMSLALAGSAIVGILALGGVHILESRGALKERADFMQKLAKEQARDAKTLAKAQTKLQAQYAQAQAESNAAGARAAKLQAQYEALPKDGEGTICPADCTLPSLQ